MEKLQIIEPSGNELQLKCMINATLTDNDVNPVMWFQLLSKNTTTPLTIKSARLNTTRMVPMKNWDTYVQNFGLRINPEKSFRPGDEGYLRVHGRMEEQQIVFQRSGQRIKFKRITPNDDGYYTCIYRVKCDNVYKIIGELKVFRRGRVQEFGVK
jgi:hypothetical protein